MEINEASLIEKEMTIRNMRLTKEVLETRRSAIRWLALTIGIINPGESRLGVISVLDALVYFQFAKKRDPSAKEIEAYINSNYGEINEKTLRYHLLRMKKMGLIKNEQGRFYFSPPQKGEKFEAEDWIRSVFDSSVSQIVVNVSEVIKELNKKSLIGELR